MNGTSKLWCLRLALGLSVVICAIARGETVSMTNLLRSIKPVELAPGVTTTLWVFGGKRYVDESYFDLSTLVGHSRLAVSVDGVVKCVLTPTAKENSLKSCRIRSTTPFITLKNEGPEIIHLYEVFARATPAAPSLQAQWEAEGAPAKELKQFAYQKPLPLSAGSVTSVAFPEGTLDVQRIYLSLRNRKPCEGLYVVANGDVVGRLRWKDRQVAYSIPIEAPLKQIELINTCSHPVQLLNLSAAALSPPEIYLSAKRVGSQAVSELQLPLRYELPAEKTSLKSAVAVVKWEDPFGWDLPFDLYDPVVLQFRAEGHHTKFVIPFPGTDVLQAAVFREASGFQLEQTSGPRVELKALRFFYYEGAKPDWNFDEVSLWKKYALEKREGNVALYLSVRVEEISKSLMGNVNEIEMVPSLARIRHAAMEASIVAEREKDFSADTLRAAEQIRIRLVESEKLMEKLLSTPNTTSRAEELIAIKYEIDQRTKALRMRTNDDR